MQYKKILKSIIIINNSRNVKSLMQQIVKVAKYEEKHIFYK